MKYLAATILLIGASCGGDPDPVGPGPGDPDAPAVEDGFEPLLQGNWTLPAQTEGYYCVYATITKDIYLDGFRPIEPLGTHHTVLTLYSGSAPDGVAQCSAATNGTSMIYGSGVGAPDYMFPTGIGMHLTAGQRLVLNLHLNNKGGDTELTGISGVKFHTTTADKIQHEAEVTLAGPIASLVVPTGGSTQHGDCTVSQFASEPITVFSMSQHMHKLGTHLKTTITPSGGSEMTVQDENYTFEQQEFHHVTPFVLNPTDKITTYCTYMNPGSTVTFGDSSDAEMCFTDLYYYPAQKRAFVCSN